MFIERKEAFLFTYLVTEINLINFLFFFFFLCSFFLCILHYWNIFAFKWWYWQKSKYNKKKNYQRLNYLDLAFNYGTNLIFFLFDILD